MTKKSKITNTRLTINQTIYFLFSNIWKSLVKFQIENSLIINFFQVRNQYVVVNKGFDNITAFYIQYVSIHIVRFLIAENIDQSIMISMQLLLSLIFLSFHFDCIIWAWNASFVTCITFDFCKGTYNMYRLSDVVTKVQQSFELDNKLWQVYIQIHFITGHSDRTFYIGAFYLLSYLNPITRATFCFSAFSYLAWMSHSLHISQRTDPKHKSYLGLHRNICT